MTRKQNPVQKFLKLGRVRAMHIELCECINRIVIHLSYCKTGKNVIMTIHHRMKQFIKHASEKRREQLWSVITRHCLRIMNSMNYAKRQQQLQDDWMELRGLLRIRDTFTHKDVAALYDAWSA